MFKLINYLLLIFCASLAAGQPMPDSLMTKYRLAKTDEEKHHFIYQYFQSSASEEDYKNRVLQLSAWYKKQNDALGADYADAHLADILNNKGDYAASLNLCFSILPRIENRTDKNQINSLYTTIGNAYFFSKNFEQGAFYYKKIIPLTSATDQKEYLSQLYNAIGCIYGEGGMPDSGMIYAQRAVNIDTEMKNFQQLALSTSTLGENYIAAKEYDIALPYLRRSMGYYLSKKAEPDSFLLAYLKNDFAQVFLANQQFDSTNFYANQSLQLSIPFGAKDQSMRSYEYLHKSYEQTNNQDSINKYFRLAMTLKDSLVDLEKVKNIQALSFREELRQQELETEKVKIEVERKTNIQLFLLKLKLIFNYF